jgi:hypothetical protein
MIRICQCGHKKTAHIFSYAPKFGYCSFFTCNCEKYREAANCGSEVTSIPGINSTVDKPQRKSLRDSIEWKNKNKGKVFLTGPVEKGDDKE